MIIKGLEEKFYGLNEVEYSLSKLGLTEAGIIDLWNGDYIANPFGEDWSSLSSYRKCAFMDKLLDMGE